MLRRTCVGSRLAPLRVARARDAWGSRPGGACADDAFRPSAVTPLAKEPGFDRSRRLHVSTAGRSANARRECGAIRPLRSAAVLWRRRRRRDSSSLDPTRSSQSGSALGIAAERGPVSAVVTVQDAREYGSSGGAFSDTFGLPVVRALRSVPRRAHFEPRCVLPARSAGGAPRRRPAHRSLR